MIAASQPTLTNVAISAKGLVNSAYVPADVASQVLPIAELGSAIRKATCSRT